VDPEELIGKLQRLGLDPHPIPQQRPEGRWPVERLTSLLTGSPRRPRSLWSPCSERASWGIMS